MLRLNDWFCGAGGAIMAAIETLTSEDSAAAIESVRELHAPMDVDVLQSDCEAEDCEHEDDCPTIEMKVYKAGYILGESIDIYRFERGGVHYVSYSCPTIQALDGSVDPAPVDPVLIGLNNTVVAELNTHWQYRVAQAWDEGFTAGVNADMGDYEHPDDGSWHTNPYRRQETTK